MSTATAAATTTTGTRQFCTFYVDDLFLGVDVLEVQEVIRHQEMTVVPLAPEVVKGLINLRGQIVTAVDLRTRMGLEPRSTQEDGDESLNVVVHTDEGAAVSLLVDAIGDVLQVSDEVLEAPPPTLPSAAGEVIDGVYKLDGTLLLVLNTKAAITVSG